ncbi:peptidoglycan editing factor PgeF [Pseudoalteromonas obscura]|uniref:Purine nucleoside phosphorylase n=1 Tax=Pseudoalteromonas obscura TaxID=3048491 RepID=A0ABT7EHN5_9GAMM|nr:peptidoglycan editing factor PgeF [Pseudoalteromonas sp. P94(2023)]MDK2594529.1 peptidoglycan editing factor PgeF [Pseudoalteromonas sp. P94(2023)]
MILPQWPVQHQVGAVSSTRLGGYSCAPYDTFNLAYHVGDNSEHVAKNRAVLESYLPAAPTWVNQVHGCDIHVVDTKTDASLLVNADALYTRLRRQPLAIMTADCLPVLLASQCGREVAAVHGGWRPLAGGIIAKTTQHFEASPDKLVAWLGPAIGHNAFEVGSEVKDTFIAQSPELSEAFRAIGNGKYLADIFLIAQMQLQALNVNSIYTDKLCTFSNKEQFFSYRRDGQCGRMATVIWRK